MGRGAREVLSRRLAASKSKGSGLVFPNPRDGRSVVGYATASAAIGRAIERGGVRPGTPHDFRHSYGRALALAGVPITVVQSQLGHKSLKMTLLYTSAAVEDSTRFVADFGIGG
jgi:integrase